MSTSPSIPLPEQIREVKREIGMRQRVYSRKVADQTMTQADMDRKIAVMQAVLSSLQRLHAETNPTLF